jgi:hypothetical protein
LFGVKIIRIQPLDTVPRLSSKAWLRAAEAPR